MRIGSGGGGVKPRDRRLQRVVEATGAVVDAAGAVVDAAGADVVDTA
jgi:hypothetical protein